MSIRDIAKKRHARLEKATKEKRFPVDERKADKANGRPRGAYAEGLQRRIRKTTAEELKKEGDI